MSANVELADIFQLLEQPMRKDDSWYLVDKKWFEALRTFVQTRDPLQNPGPIDNGPLFTKPFEGGELKRRLREELDYVFLPEQAWQVLLSNCGVVDEHHVIRRQVIDHGSFTEYCMVEIYPPTLSLCLYGSEQDVILQTFSAVTTLKELESEMRRIFNVESTRDSLVWSKGEVINPPIDSQANVDSGIKRKKYDNRKLFEASVAGISRSSVVALEVQNLDGSWPSSGRADDVHAGEKTAGLCGLMNLGHTCYMNTALQCMSNTPALAEYFLQEKHFADVNVFNPLGTGGAIANTYGELMKSLWSAERRFVTPRDFKMAIGEYAPQFTFYRQQDTQELMSFLLDGLHEDLNRITEKPYIAASDETEKRADEVIARESWENYKKRNDSIIVDTFHALLKSTITCPECAHVSVKFDPYCYLSVPLPETRERAIDVTFIPAMRDERDSHARPIKISRLIVPNYGDMFEIFRAVADSLRHHPELALAQLDPRQMIAADVHNHRFYKLYSREDAFSPDLDVVHVYETVKDRVAIPVYLRALRANKSSVLFGRPFFVYVEDKSYTSVFNSISDYIRAYFKTRFPKDAVAHNLSFTLSVVNALGTVDIAAFDEQSAIESPDEWRYLAVNFDEHCEELLRDGEWDDVVEIPMFKRVDADKQSVSLSDCIEQYIKAERLGEDDPWYCSSCKKHQQATKKIDLWSLPDVLIIQLKRFSYSRFRCDKLDVLVDFPVTGLDLGPYIVSADKDGQLYDVVAVANHRGLPGDGAYTAFAKNKNTGRWHYFSDNRVTDAKEDDVKSDAAYVLFYQKRA